jgi:hypothetical protein
VEFTCKYNGNLYSKKIFAIHIPYLYLRLYVLSLNLPTAEYALLYSYYGSILAHNLRSV